MTETMLPSAGADGSTDELDGFDGLPEILSALSALDTLDASTVAEHVAVFESIHRSLQAILEEPEHR